MTFDTLLDFVNKEEKLLLINKS